jgi:putative transposase
MKSYTFRAKLEDLGIISSYSRPRVSDDNPYIESLFRTVKYSQFWPSRGFESLTQAREWVKHFVNWYNDEHRHSKIGFITAWESNQTVYLTPERKNLGEVKTAA